MTQSRSQWNTEEDNFIRHHWNTHTSTQIAEMMPRTSKSIYQRARTLGLVRRDSDWTEDEINKLKTFYRVATHGELAEFLGRTESGVHHKMERLGLFRHFTEWDNREMSPSLAHLLGMTLTDGHLYYNGSSGSLSLSHTSIDREYVESSIDAFANACGRHYGLSWPIKMREEHRHQPWTIDLTNNELNHWIAEQTDWKKKFPVAIWRADRDSQLSFVAAMLDGDGWMSEHKQPRCSTMRYEIGFCSESKWIFEFGSFLQSIGIQLRRTHKQVLKSGKDFYYLTIDKKTFVSSGGYFRIDRKMARLQRYVESHLDSFPQRPYAPPLPKRMIWPAQRGDALSAAEMTAPCQQAE